MHNVSKETCVYKKRPAKETYVHIAVEDEKRAHISEARVTYLQYA